MTVFTVGQHEVRVWREPGRWRVAVDDSTCRHGFMTQAQAAGAGLLRAGNLDGAAERMRPVRPAA